MGCLIVDVVRPGLRCRLLSCDRDRGCMVPFVYKPSCKREKQPRQHIVDRQIPKFPQEVKAVSEIEAGIHKIIDEQRYRDVERPPQGGQEGSARPCLSDAFIDNEPYRRQNSHIKNDHGYGCILLIVIRQPGNPE